ncbi:MAG: RND family transporter [Gammaproteobacteria bacterium]
MMNRLYTLITQFPKGILFVVFGLTVFLYMQISTLEWETDARVYLPKGHAAILYDEKVDEIFGVKDAFIIEIVNEEKTIFNAETLQRISRITEKVAALPGVIANRTIDVMSLSTASAFIGDEVSIGTDRLMETVPENDDAIKQIREKVYANEDLFVGNIVSEDGTVAVIRARLKEGIQNRYSTYFAIKGILDKERGISQSWGGWGGGGDWQNQDWNQDSEQKPKNGGDSGKNPWWNGESAAEQLDEDIKPAIENGDALYMAGRPVVEVTSGLDALTDIKKMIPLLVIVIVALLFAIFRTFRGVILPVLVVACAVIWTMGLMALLGFPMYTISTMLPVILVAVGIGDSMHLLSHYYDNVLKDPYRESGQIVIEVMQRLGPPLITTSITTAIGFVSLTFAEMPPFKIFGLFTVIGILFSWLLSITLIPAFLTLLKPKVGGYLEKRRSIRVHEEDGLITRTLAAWTRASTEKRNLFSVVLVVVLIIMSAASSTLFVDSSWMSDFRKDSEVVQSSNILNKKMDGSIFLNVIVEGSEPDAINDPALLRKIETLQSHIGKLPFVGDSLSIVDYLKSINKNLNAGNDAYKVLPDTKAEIAEFMFLLSLSGRPEILDEVIDYDYRQTNVSFLIQTDHTKDLKRIIDETQRFIDSEFAGMNVNVNLAGSANNSFVWADLLIDSQVIAILFSKIGIFLIATLLFRSVIAGFLVVIPVTVTTVVMAGLAGLMGIPLDVSTALAAGVAIGVGVDYAVHYLFRYRAMRAVNDNHFDATLLTMRSVGKTIVFNATVVTIGFLVLFASQFPPHVKLGLFVAAYMVLSCLSALISLPLVLSVCGHRMKKA